MASEATRGTQSAAILHHLQTVGPITPLDALKLYGCFRLGARIYDLKAEGQPIVKEMVTVGDGKHVARYSLAPDDQQAA